MKMHYIFLSISRNPDVTDIESTAVPTDYTPR